MTKIFDENQAITITTKTFDNLTKLGSDSLNLYMKYIYHSKIQKANQIYATVGFMAKGLGWGRDRTRKVKGILKKEGYIEDIIGRTDNKKFAKWFVKINGLITSKKLKKLKVYPTENLEGRKKVYPTENLPYGKPVGKCLKDNNNKCLKYNKLERGPASKKTHLGKDKNSHKDLPDVNSSKQMAAAAILPHLEQDVENTVSELLSLAINEALKYNQGFAFGNNSELAKFLRKKIRVLIKEGEDIASAKGVLHVAITSYYRKWIQDEYYGERRAAFGLVKTLETQWKILTS